MATNMEESTVHIDQIWAETTDTVISWVSALSEEDLMKVIRYFRLSTEGKEGELRWRVIRFHQHCKLMNVTWDDAIDFTNGPAHGIHDVTATVSYEPTLINAPPLTETPHIAIGQRHAPINSDTVNLDTVDTTPISRSTMFPSAFRGITTIAPTRTIPQQTCRPNTEQHGNSPSRSSESSSCHSYATAIQLLPTNPFLDPPSPEELNMPRNSTLFEGQQPIVPSSVLHPTNPFRYGYTGGSVPQSYHNLSSHITPSVNVLECVRKWNISYSGKKDSSAEEFLTRVQECRRGSALSDNALLEAMPHLLKGGARHWFRLLEDQIKTWPEFVRAFRKRFVGVNFQFKIKEEARRRTQGKDEPISEYLQNLRLILRRFDPPISEREQLQLAYCNLHPQYRASIPHREFGSFEELETAGELYEASLAMAKTYLPPPCAEDSVLPELAYSGHKERVRAVAAAGAVPIETQKISSQRRDRVAKNSKKRNTQTGNVKSRLGEVNNPSSPCALTNPISQTPIIPTPNMMGYPPPGYPPFGFYPNISHPPFGPTAFSYSTSESAPMQNTDTFPTAAVTDRVKARPIPPARSPPTNPTARIVRSERRPGCWNCLETGHYYTACTKPKQRFCHACGEPGQLARSCSGCSGPRPGNE